MSEIDSYCEVSRLRSLAEAIEQRRDANSLPGIGAPSKIIFANQAGTALTGYGSNPTLLAAIEREIRLSWDELRARALTRLDDSVAQLTAQVSTDLGRAALAEHEAKP